MEPCPEFGEGETRERMVCMAGQNKVRVEICGSRYVVSSNEPVEYVKRLANTIESKVKTYMDSSPNVTLTDAYFLALLSYADLYEKSEQNADHIRSQLTEYLEDSTRAKLEIDQYKRENERLKKEIGSTSCARTSGASREGLLWIRRNLPRWTDSSLSRSRK